MSAPTSPSTRPNRTLHFPAALVAVLALVLATMVATAANARAQDGEIADPAGSQDAPVLLIAQRAQNQISSVPLAGGPVSLVTDIVDSPQSVIRHGDTLFVSEGTYAEGRVVSVPVDGGEATTVATGLTSPRGLLVVGETLYIADSTNNRVVAVPVGGGEVTEIVTGLDSPRGLATAGDSLFIADRDNNRVVTAPLGGGAHTEFKTFAEEIGYLAIAGDTLYISAMNGTVWSMPVADRDAEPREFVTGLSGIRGLATDGETLYMGEAGGFDEDDRIRAKSLDGGELRTVADAVGINDIAISGTSAPCTEWSCVPLLGSLFGSLG